MTEPSIVDAIPGGWGGAFGMLVGSGFLGSFLRGIWTARQDKRVDAANSANTNAEIRSLGDFERRAKEAEATADKEHDERLTAERKQQEAEALQRDAERDLRAARRDIRMMQRHLDRAKVARSDWAPFLETTIGDLPEPKA